MGFQPDNGKSRIGLCGSAPYSFAQYGSDHSRRAAMANNYFQPWGTALLPGNILVIGDQGGKFIFTLPIIPGGVPSCSAGNCSPTATPGSNNANAATLILLSMTKRPNTVAADKFGNIYFTEDSGGLPGALHDSRRRHADSFRHGFAYRSRRSEPRQRHRRCDGREWKCLRRRFEGRCVHDSESIGNPEHSGRSSPDDRCLLLAASAWTRCADSFMSHRPNGTYAMVSFNTRAAWSNGRWHAHIAGDYRHLYLQCGARRRRSIVIEEAGATTPDFTIASGGTCKAGTAYAAGSTCTVNVTLNPHAAGSVSAKLLMLDGSGNVLASMPLSGIGNGTGDSALARRTQWNDRQRVEDAQPGCGRCSGQTSISRTPDSAQCRCTRRDRAPRPRLEQD